MGSSGGRGVTCSKRGEGAETGLEDKYQTTIRQLIISEDFAISLIKEKKLSFFFQIQNHKSPLVIGCLIVVL